MSTDRRTFLLTGGAAVAASLIPETVRADVNEDADAVLKDHVAKLRPLEIGANEAWWKANISGNDEDFARKEEAQNKIDAALSDKKMFERVKPLKAAADKGEIKDPLVARQIQLIYLQYLEKQVAPELLKKITAKANAVEQSFNVFRAKVDGEEIADSKVRSTLKQSVDSELRKKVWEASKRVGAVVEADLAELVKLRNEAATQLGFKNFHAMMLTLSEQDGTELIALFDDLDKLTKEPFTAAKKDIDARLSKKLGVKVDELMPWHYHDPFFQESPAVFDANLDAPYIKADLLKLCSTFYSGIGLPIDRVIARSDLYEKKGKSPHAFCTDIDREGDVRVLANIVNNEYWMGTMLHELGHAVYSSMNIPQTLPYLLRAEAHILTTEGVAMQFERFSKSRAWLDKMGVKVENAKAFDEAAAKVQRNQLLIFSRWCQVMLRFEKSMYENPNQDLNKLWWENVEKYQQVKKPKDRNAPDYAAKIHICSAPVYYHNYMMGQLFASQVHHALAKDLYAREPSTVIYVGDKRVGDFMKKKVFDPGRSKTWKELTKFATGEELNPKAFAKDFQAS
ncbi:MAG: M2 family metallopeptidase [Planctomycetia bacterium]|nr:M2 family metallopeptidase [Planctomycetia bacterium]